MRHLFIVFSALFLIAGCNNQPDDGAGPQQSPESGSANILSLDIVGWSFQGPDEIDSGWTTIRINNTGGMAHFGLVYRLPEGVTAEMMRDEVINPFQEGLTASLNGDFEAAAEIMGSLPAYVGDIVYMGGPGMMSDGVVAEATMYLEPGNYIVECYVKTDGVQHNYSPVQGEHGMVLPLTVREAYGDMAEPEANVTLQINNSGYEVMDGQFVAGENIVRVDFAEQRLYNNFVGHDAHLFRIEEDTDVEATASWIDFFPMDGQQTPAPAHFVGGIHDMPEGSTAYFTVYLEEGDYAITAEIPDAMGQGFFHRFSVPGE